MKTITIKTFNGLDDDEKKEITENALSIYKFFRAYCGVKLLINAQNDIYFEGVLDKLCFFLPFVKKNYDTIIGFNEEERNKFLTEIDDCIEKTFKENNFDISLTAKDFEMYSSFCEDFCEKIKRVIESLPGWIIVEFLEKHKLLFTLFNEYIN